MTFPIAEVSTYPFCGSCGRETYGPPVFTDLANDLVCDGCGADLLAFGYAATVPPTALLATPGSLQVTFTWTANPGADSTESRSKVAANAWSAWATDTSPTVVVAAAGETVLFEVRSIVNGVPGPSIQTSGVATA